MFCKGELLTLVISVWGTYITREMCLGAQISRGNTYHCNSWTNKNILTLNFSQFMLTIVELHHELINVHHKVVHIRKLLRIFLLYIKD